MRKLAMAAALAASASLWHAASVQRERTLAFTKLRRESAVRVAYADSRCAADCRVAVIVDDSAAMPLAGAGSGRFVCDVRGVAPGSHVLEMRVDGAGSDGRWDIEAEEVP